MNSEIQLALFRNAIVFFNEAIHHFNLGISRYDNKILTIINLQIALELSIKYAVANNFSIDIIFEEKCVEGLSEEDLLLKYQKNELKVKEFQKLKNFLKSHKSICEELSDDFSYMDKFQNYRNKLVHQNYNFDDEEEKNIENDIIHIIVHIIYKLLNDSLYYSDSEMYLYQYIPKNEYKKLLLNSEFSEEIRNKFEMEHDKLYIYPYCGCKSLTPLKESLLHSWSIKI